MAVSLVGVLLLVASIVSCESDKCPKGKYWDPDYVQCRNCSPCPRDVIIFGSTPDFGAMYDCKKHKSLCPNWCAVDTPISDANEGRDACPPTTPSPPVPYVNVTIDEPLYNATTNAYTASCSAFYINMGVPHLEWTNPSGQVLTPTAASGKWNVNQEQVTQGTGTLGPLTLQVKDFQEGDEGNYTCSAQGEQSAHRTIFLKYMYVKTPVIMSSPSPTSSLTSTSASSSPPQNTAKHAETSSSKGFSTFKWIAIALGVVTTVICIILAFLLKRLKSSSGNSSEDVEKLPLTDLKSRLSLRTSDFKSATVEGIQAYLDLSCCAAVVICRKNKKNITVRNENDKIQNTVYISDVSWNDRIEVWIKYRDKKRQFIEMLSMPCLKIVDVSVTSAVINCPNVNDTFFLRYGEKDASFHPVEPMQGGSKEIHDLLPNVTYCVELGTRGRDGDSGAYNWRWKDDFTTKGLEFQLVKTKDSAKLQLQMPATLPESLDLHYAVNSFDDSKLKKMESCAIDIQDLIPGMGQVVQLKVKERRESLEEYRLLLEEHFRTKGEIKYGGDYDDDTTTDTESVKTPNALNTCTTGLNDAFHNLRHSDTRKAAMFYNASNPAMSQAVMECLRKVYRVKNTSKWEPDEPGSVRKLADVEKYFREKAMYYTGVFDILREFVQLEEMHTQSGIDYANHFLNAHNSKCRYCEHAYFLLRWHTEKKKKKKKVQSSGS